MADQSAIIPSLGELEATAASRIKVKRTQCLEFKISTLKFGIISGLRVAFPIYSKSVGSAHQ